MAVIGMVKGYLSLIFKSIGTLLPTTISVVSPRVIPPGQQRWGTGVAKRNTESTGKEVETGVQAPPVQRCPLCPSEADPLPHGQYQTLH